MRSFMLPDEENGDRSDPIRSERESSGAHTWLQVSRRSTLSADRAAESAAALACLRDGAQ